MKGISVASWMILPHLSALTQRMPKVLPFCNVICRSHVHVPMAEWYKVSHEELVKRNGRGLLARFGNSHVKLLTVLSSFVLACRLNLIAF